MTEEMLAQAREAQSAEELLQLAKDNGMDEFTMEDAEDLYAQMHVSGEMSDEEMENVSGGCSTKVDGVKYTVVTSMTECFTGQYKACHYVTTKSGEFEEVWERTDNKSLRKTWDTLSSGANSCGSCVHLGFKSGSGYCEVS